MQALKKAERAKQNSVGEEELDKPSEAFDEMLALTPEPAPLRPPPTGAAATSLSLEPMEGLSLEPLAPPVAATAEARPSPSPQPAASDHQAAGLTLDLTPDPAAPSPVAEPLAFTPAVQPASAGAPGAAATLPPSPVSKQSAAAPRPASAQRAPGATAGTASAAASAATAAAAQANAKPSAAAADNPRAAARARARAAATAEPSRMDPERLRLIALIALLVLLAGGFGFYYWRALTGPGAGAGLPPVPMPPPGATGATPAQAVVATITANGAPGAAATADTAADTGDDPMLAPAGGTSSRANQQELERRIARTEQELAAAQQAIQAAAAPRQERMPVLAAPDNSDIRVARATQASTVAPVLDSAYLAFNSGDLKNAQQQYGAALQQDPTNRDALLGMASVSTGLNQKDQAASYYLRLLELSPNDAAATAGLIGLRQGDISQSEGRLKAILASNPEAGPVLFTLGNLYAQQGRWQDAQQAYFRAVGVAPDNPDYAYNLAVGLDRLNQPKLALNYYQRALTLAQDKAVSFNRDTLRQRMHELTSAAH